MGERKEKIVDVMRSTGLARNTIAGLYSEDVARIDLSTLETLCQHYNCNVSELIEFIPNEPR